MSNCEQEDAEIREVEKARTIESLRTPEGRREFMGEFERILKKYRKFIRLGGDFKLQSDVIEDLKKRADRIRGEWPDVAKFIDHARKKIEDLIKREKEKWEKKKKKGKKKKERE